jgi:LysW-gamma-L-lysine carboxypeptidase
LSKAADPVEFLDLLVRTPSPSGSEQKVAAACKSFLSNFAFEQVGIDKAGNAVATNYKHKPGDCPDLLLFGHMDTISSPMPYSRTKSSISGRGAVDAKSPLAAMMTAAGNCAGNLPYKLMVAGVVEEESTSSKGIRHLLTYAKPKMAINGEPSNLSGITIAYKGRLVVECRTQGKPSHAGMVSENPIERTFEYYSLLRQAYPLHKHNFDNVIINLTQIHGGSRDAINVVPETLDFVIDVRVPPSIPTRDVAATFRDLAPSSVKVKIDERIEGVQTDPNHPLCRAMVSSMRKEGITPRYLRKSGSADMNITAHAGVPTIAYGPGDSALDHTPNEVILIDDYLKSIRILEGALGNLKAAFA